MRSRITVLGLALVILVLAITAVTLVLTASAYTPALPGVPDTGPVVGWGLPIVRALSDIGAIVTIGALLSAVVLAPAGKDGVVSRAGRADLRWAAGAAAIWAILCITQLFFVTANVLGLPLRGMTPQVISTYALSLPSARALLIMAVLALIVSAGCAATFTTGLGAIWLITALIAAMLPALGGHAAGLGDHSLALTAGAAHIAAACVWIGGVLALGLHAARGALPMAVPIKRFSPIAVTCIAILAVSGIANAYTHLEDFTQVVTTGYGQVVLLKTGLIVVLGVIGWLIRSRIAAKAHSRSGTSVFARIAGLELMVMGIAVGLGVGLALSSSPRLTVEFPSYGESLLGAIYPPAPTVSNVLTGFHLEPFFAAVALVAIALYLAGVVRLVRRGVSWPIGRTIAWLAGWIIIAWATNGGISLYAQVSIGMHMLDHMVLTMLAPILLVLAAPVTLALRALRPATGDQRGPREWLLWVLHSWIGVLLTNPFYVFFVYVIGLYGLYFTPIFGWLMGSHLGHLVMNIHFVTSGYLFYWVVIGIDPRPRPLAYWSRLLLLLLSLAVHAFFAVILMMTTVQLAPQWYGIVRPDWVTNPVQDAVFGGQVAWGISEIPSLIVLIAIAVQWSRSDDREAKRKDRQADRDGDAELNAYNEHLAKLSGRHPQ